MRIKWLSIVRLMGLFWVLTYHFFKNHFTGGFIGVDILFTLSGFLITANWLDEYAKSESIDLVRFGQKRLYRILPPVVLMILVVMPFTFLVKRDFVAGIGLQITSALGFTTNFYEMLTGGNYESQFVPHLFLHTWSLAVEMQFYVIWGLVVWLISKKKATSNEFRGFVFVVSAILFGMSFVTMFVQAFLVDNLSLIYFSPFTRSFAFFLGSIVATVSGIRETTGRFRRHVALFDMKKILASISLATVLLLLLGKFLDFTHLFTYLFGFLLASLVTSVLLYSVRLLSDQTPDIEEPFVLIILADLSYGIYLFHWPLYIIFGQLASNGLAVVLTLVFSIIFSGLSYYIVEPIIAGKTPNLLGVTVDFKEYYKWSLGGLGLLVAITIGITVTAPKVGAFETDLLVSSLNQADNRLDRTHTLLAGDAKAVSDVLIIGDSVTLRASAAIEELLPEARLDAEVSRDFTKAYDIFHNEIKNDSLSKTVVLAVGVNSVYNYDKDLENFISDLPKGTRLVIVTPYNTGDGRVPELRGYEVELAKKYSYITVADWYKTSLANPHIWSGTDGVHFSEATPDGARLYAETIQKAIKKASKQPAKGEKSNKK